MSLSAGVHGFHWMLHIWIFKKRQSGTKANVAVVSETAVNKSCSSQWGSKKSNKKHQGEKSEPGKQREKIRQLMFQFISSTGIYTNTYARTRDLEDDVVLMLNYTQFGVAEET